MVTTNNSCGDCTACCDLFPVDELGKTMNEKCVHCEGGCTIYVDRPRSCSLFECAYLQSSAPESLRPDNCGVIYEKLSDRLFFGTAFRVATEQGVAQARAFVAQGFSVVVASSTGRFQPRVYIAEGHDENEIRDEFFGRVKAVV